MLPIDPWKVKFGGQLTHLAAFDLLDHANAIRLPTILPTVPVSTDPEVEANLNAISGVADGIRTHNNRNHKATVSSLRPKKSTSYGADGRRKTCKKRE
jgi:hypothetical protein